MTIETKHIELTEFEVKFTDAGHATIEGYASTFGNTDNQNDIVLPGAFKESLAQRMPKMLYQHDPHRIPGVWEKAAEDSKGLILAGRTLNTTLGRDAAEEVRSGAIDRLSIGYSPTKATFDKGTGTRRLAQVKLWETSLVTFPANDQAAITSAKSASGDIDTAVGLLAQAAALCRSGMDMTPEACATICQLVDAAATLLDEPNEDTTSPDPEEKARPATLRQFEKFLREAGHFSPKDATTVALRGFKALEDRGEPGADALDHLTRLFNQFTA